MDTLQLFFWAIKISSNFYCYLRHPVPFSILNVQEEGVAIGDTGYVWDIYEDSLKMSTYLLAFVVSDFVFRKSEPQPNGVEFREDINKNPPFLKFINNFTKEFWKNTIILLMASLQNLVKRGCFKSDRVGIRNRSQDSGLL